jgi:TRAP-type C4-dicarboxylate transport system substrate-binding protein
MCVFALLAACGSSDTGTSDANGEEVFEWSLASIYTDPSTSTEFNAFGVSQQTFADLVEEKTEGRIKINNYYNSVLGANPEMFQNLRIGDLAVYYGEPMANVDERLGVLKLPYLFRDFEDVEKVLSNPDGELFHLYSEWLAGHDVKLLAVAPGAFRGITNAKHPVVGIDDVSDLVLRIYEDPVVNTFWGSISNAQPLAFSEVYTALETGTIDGLEFLASSVVQRQFYEVSDHYTDIDWQWASGGTLMIGKEYWDALPEDLQEIVQEAAWEAMAHQGELEKEFTQIALGELEEKGVQVYQLTDEERSEWIDYARSLDEDFRDYVGADVFDQVMEIIESID